MSGSRFCENCGQPLVNGVCPNCNAQTAPVSEEIAVQQAPAYTSFCENCGQPLVNGVCPNCNAQTAPVSEEIAVQQEPAYTPYCEIGHGGVVQQCAEHFGFFKENDEKIQFVDGEEYFEKYLAKRKLSRKGFMVVTDKNAYLCGKTISIVQNMPVGKEKCVRTYPLTEISSIGASGKFLDEKKRKNKILMTKIIGFIPIILAAVLLFFCMFAMGNFFGVLLFFGAPLSMPLIIYGVVYIKVGSDSIKFKALFNVQHANGTLQLKLRRLLSESEPLARFINNFDYCIKVAKAAEEERLAEEARIAEEQRLAEEERLAEEKRIAEEKAKAAEEKAKADEEERIRKQAEAMQAAMKEAVQTAPANNQPDTLGQLKQFAEMRQQGLITDEEFAAFKAKLLNN